LIHKNALEKTITDISKELTGKDVAVIKDSSLKFPIGTAFTKDIIKYNDSYNIFKEFVYHECGHICTTQNLKLRNNINNLWIDAEMEANKWALLTALKRNSKQFNIYMIYFSCTIDFSNKYPIHFIARKNLLKDKEFLKIVKDFGYKNKDLLNIVKNYNNLINNK